MQNISGSQASPEIPINENFTLLACFQVYGMRAPTTNGLTWGYWGGRWGGIAITDGTLSLTASATNYVVVAKASGAITVSTTSTNWDNTTDYKRVYKVTTGASAVSGYEDHRVGLNGIFG